MEAFLVATGVVAIAEIGDKTQLLALLLAARYRRPWPILAGILAATLANHALAAVGGTLIAGWLGPAALRWTLGLAFLAMAVWVLIPDKADAARASGPGAGPFVATLIAFFLVEIGDKTQVATVALAARYDSVLVVTLGTTLGMLFANAPVVWLGDVTAGRLPLGGIRITAAALFALLGVVTLAGVMTVPG